MNPNAEGRAALWARHDREILRDKMANCSNNPDTSYCSRLSNNFLVIEKSLVFDRRT